MQYLVALIAGLVGFGLFQTIKRNSAEALLQNLNEKQKVIDDTKKISENDGQLASEEQKREEEKQPIKPVDNDSLNDFFNNSNKK